MALSAERQASSFSARRVGGAAAALAGAPDMVFLKNRIRGSFKLNLGETSTAPRPARALRTREGFARGGVEKAEIGRSRRQPLDFAGNRQGIYLEKAWKKLGKVWIFLVTAWKILGKTWKSLLGAPCVWKRSRTPPASAKRVLPPGPFMATEKSIDPSRPGLSRSPARDLCQNAWDRPLRHGVDARRKAGHDGRSASSQRLCGTSPAMTAPEGFRAIGVSAATP